MSFIDLNKVVKENRRIKGEFNQDELLELMDSLFCNLKEDQIRKWLTRPYIKNRIGM